MTDPTRFDDSKSYGRTDLARKYRSTAGTQAPAAPAQLQHCLDAIEQEGYVIVENCIESELLDSIRTDLLARLEHKGRNNFEGFKTQRLYALLEKTFVCNPLVEHPLVLGVLDHLFSPNYLLSQLQAINILPEEDAQPLHHDDAFYPIPRPRAPLGAAVIYAIDDFTAENGATVVVPGSHRLGDVEPDSEMLRQARPAVMPAGAALIFIGTLWHGGGANRSSRSRLCVTAQYCAPWCRQQENFSLSVSRDRVKACSEHIQRLVGYSIHPPFVGFVNGMHPKRLLE